MVIFNFDILGGIRETMQGYAIISFMDTSFPSLHPLPLECPF